MAVVALAILLINLGGLAVLGYDPLNGGAR